MTCMAACLLLAFLFAAKHALVQYCVEQDLAVIRCNVE